MPSPAPSAARSAIWNHLGKMGDYALMYVGSIVLARGLGIDAYGRYAALVSGIHVLLAFSSFGLEAALTRHIASFQGNGALERSRFLARRGILVRCLLFAIAAIAGYGIAAARGWLAPPVDHLLLMLVGGYGLSRAVVAIAAAVLTARFRTARVAVISVAGRILEVAGFLVAGTYGLTLPAVFAVFLTSGITQILLHLFWCSGHWFGEESAVPLRPVLVFAGVFGINALVDYFLGRQGDIALLALLWGDPTATSRYDVAYSLLQAGSMVATLGLTGVVLAVLSRLPAEDRIRRAGAYETIVRLTSLLTIPVLGLLFITAGDLLSVVYTAPFASAAPVLQTLIGLRIIARLFGGGENADLLLSLDQVSALVTIGIIAAGITVALHLVLIPVYGATGAAVGSGIGAMSANALSMRRVVTSVPAKIQWRSWFLVTTSTVLAGAVAALVFPHAASVMLLIAKSSAFGAVLIGSTILFRPIEMQDSAALTRALPFVRSAANAIARQGRHA